jgi:hypothetical protein
MGNENIKSMIAPSVKTIKATFDEVNISAKLIKTNIESILETLKVIDDTLDIFTNSGSLSSQLQSINPFSLLPTTVKIATEIISKYVYNKTGISFADWAKFVDSTLKQFGEYTNQLGKVAELSLKYNNLNLNTSDDKQEISKDEVLLLEVKSKTRVWKGYIENIAKLILVIDAILDSQKEAIKKTTKNQEVSVEVDSDTKKLLGVITDKIDVAAQNRAKEMLVYFFSSISGLKSKTNDFSHQTRDLLPKISELENLLDLGIAQIQAHAGKISLQEVEVLEARVAATVTVPQLKNRLIDLRQSVENYNVILEKLNIEHNNKRVDDNIYMVLLPEYEDKLNTFVTLLSQTEKEANVWKTDGISYLESGVAWIQKELDIIRIRKLVGQLSVEELQQRSKYLNQEMRRLDSARQILASL